MDLLNKCYDLLSSFIIILIHWKKYSKYDVRFIFEWRKLFFWTKYRWQGSIGSTILQPFQFEAKQKKMCGNESHEKEAKPIHSSTADLLNPHGRYVKIDAYFPQFLCRMTSDIKLLDMVFSFFTLLFKSFILWSKRTLTIKQILIILNAVVHRCSSKLGSSLIYNTSAKHERHECNTSSTNATWVQH